MFNVQALSQTLSAMPLDRLQGYLRQHQDDPYVVALGLSIAKQKKEAMAAQQGMAGRQPMPKVAQQEIDQIAPRAMPMPENVGIGQLPAQNLAHMAGGGIVAFDDGGEVPRYRKDGSLFDDAFDRTLRYESGYTEDTGGPTKYGISKKAHPDVDIKNLTKDEAKKIYKEKYWDAISGDKLANISPALAAVAFDAAVNQGVDKAMRFVEQSGGDPAKLLALRGQHYDSLVQNNPDVYGKYATGWKNRLTDLTASVIPSATAGELDKKPLTKAEKKEERKAEQAWYDRYRELLTTGEGQKAMLHGLQDVPAALLGAPADIGAAVLRPFGYTQQPTMGSKWWEQTFQDLGIRVPDSTNPDLQTLRAGTTGVASLVNPVGKAEAVETGLAAAARRQAQAAADAEAAVKYGRLAGPTTDATMVQKPGFSPVVQGPAVARQAEDIARAQSEAARATELSKAASAQKVPQFQTGVNPLAAVAAAGNAAPGVTSLLQGQDQVAPAEQPTQGAQAPGLGMNIPGATPTPTPTPTPAVQPAQGGVASLFNDPMFLIGARLLAGKSPYAAQNIGEAITGTAADLAAQKKADIEEKYYGALAKRAEALSKTEGLTGNTQLAYFLGEGTTPEQRVKTGLPILNAMNTQIKALELTAEQQKTYWEYYVKEKAAGAEPLDPRTWALKSRAVTAFTQPRGVNTIAEGQSVYGR
jgi:Glycosyl hydrolase 108